MTNLMAKLSSISSINVLMFSFEGIMKLMTENSQKRSSGHQFNYSRINWTLIALWYVFPRILSLIGGWGTHCYPLFLIFDDHKFSSMRRGKVNSTLPPIQHGKKRYHMIVDLKTWWELMRKKVTKYIRNVLLERAVTGIGARSSCAICPLNNI